MNLKPPIERVREMLGDEIYSDHAWRKWQLLQTQSSKEMRDLVDQVTSDIYWLLRNEGTVIKDMLVELREVFNDSEINISQPVASLLSHIRRNAKIVMARIARRLR